MFSSGQNTTARTIGSTAAFPAVSEYLNGPEERGPDDSATSADEFIVAAASQPPKYFSRPAVFGAACGISQLLLQRQEQVLLSHGEFTQTLYEVSPKLRVRDDEMGLDFDVAVIDRKNAAPYLSTGGGFMFAGNTFVFEDFFVDLGPAEKDMFMKLIAVHEYGEKVLGSHHMATRLELAYAEKMNILEPYLEFLVSRQKTKLRDLSVRFDEDSNDEFMKYFLTHHAHPAENSDSIDASAKAAMNIAERYQIPELVHAKYAGILDEDKGQLEKARDSFWVGEQAASFYNRAAEDAENAVLESLRNGVEDAGELRLKMRLALFRVLGVFKNEVDQNILAYQTIDRSVRSSLHMGFIGSLRNRFSNLSTSEKEHAAIADAILSDPVLAMSEKDLLRIATADHMLWSENFGLRLDPDPNNGTEKNDARLIDAIRKAAWRRVADSDNTAGAIMRKLGGFRRKIKNVCALSDIPNIINSSLEKLNGEHRLYAGPDDMAIAFSREIFEELVNSGWHLYSFSAELVDISQDTLNNTLPEAWAAFTERRSEGPVAFSRVSAAVDVKGALLFGRNTPKVRKLMLKEAAMRIGSLLKRYLTGSGLDPELKERLDAEISRIPIHLSGYPESSPSLLATLAKHHADLFSDAELSYLFDLCFHEMSQYELGLHFLNFSCPLPALI